MKTFLKITAAVFALIVIAAAIFLLTFDLNRHKGRIERVASEALGYAVSIESLEMKLSLVPTIRANKIRLTTRAGTQAPFVQIDTAEITLSLLPLLGNKIDIRDVRFGKASVVWENRSAVQTDKKPEKETSDAASPAPPPPLDVPQLRVDSISLKEVDISYQADGKTQRILLSDTTLKQLRVFSTRVQYAGQLIEISGNMDDIERLLRHEPDYKFQVDWKGWDMSGKVSGRIDNIADIKDVLLNLSGQGASLKKTLSYAQVNNAAVPAGDFSFSTILQIHPSEIKIAPLSFQVAQGAFKGDFNGTVKLSAPPQAELTGTLALSDSPLGESWGLQAFAANLGVSVSPEIITINRATLIANRSDIMLTGNVQLAAKPVATLSVASAYWEQQDLFREKADLAAPAPASAPKERLFSAEPLDFSALNLANGSVSVNMKHIPLRDSAADFISIQGAASLTDGVLELSQLDIKALDGVIKGKALLNARQQPAQISVALTGQNVNISKMKAMREVVRDSRLKLTLDLTAQGDSVQALMSRLNGRVMAELSQGVVVNKWFNTLPAVMGLMKSQTRAVSFSTSDREAKVVCGAANLEIKNGRIENKENIALETSAINFLIDSAVDLEKEQVTLAAAPFVSTSEGQAYRIVPLAQHIKITGPLASPTSVALDTQKAAESLLNAGVNQLLKSVAGSAAVEKEPETLAPQTLCRRVLRTEEPQTPVSSAPAVYADKPAQQNPRELIKDQLLRSVSKALQ